MILKRLFANFVILTSFFSCFNYDKPAKPENLISKDKMVDIILDIRLLSSATGSNKTILEKNNLEAENYVYNKHGVDSLQFALSNNYYAYFIDDYKAIYEKAQDSLERLKKQFDVLVAQEAEDKALRDSLSLVVKNNSKHILQLRESLKSLTEKEALNLSSTKDSLRLTKIKDTLALLKKKDSVLQLKLKPKTKAKLIKPVRDIDLQ
ncbi:DUF4296 domain-containing protein [Oceanihabitans sp. IOP_32]|uniref:DUF4296 domain-containing protein n=1 Tax=Oceanihabitans sp. IOP_32 TaxID=2529032 RepID=UPI0012939322|nr:DUF4296 domain-containing protein [Oceanihabitans sp. IOP_32]QFZ54010.1 DUF4296 domain-containing protein [Oceanihabitans sp. IOP_32]